MADPTPDERPDTAEMRYSAQAVEDTMRNGQGDDAAAFLREAADWIDAHRRPTPEGDVLAELRAVRATYDADADWPLIAAVDRLLARGGG